MSLVAESSSTRVSADVAAPPRLPLARQITWILATTFVLDTMVILSAVVIGWERRSLMDAVLAGGVIDFHLPLTVTVVLVWLIALIWRGGYQRRNVGAGFDEFRAVLLASGTTLAVMTAAAYFGKLELSRRFLLLSALLGTAGLMAERYVVRKMIHRARRNGKLRNRVLAVSTPMGLSELMTTLDRAESSGYSVVGTVLPDPQANRDLELPVPLYGGTDELLKACRDAEADTVIVAGGAVPSSVLRRIGWALEGQNIDLVVVPTLVDVAGPRIHMRHISGLPLVHVEEPQTGRAGGIGKRVFDVALTLGGLILLSPVLLPLFVVIAVMIKLDDGGPIFFRQERAGVNGQVFKITKFRSMAVDAEQRLADMLKDADQAELFIKLKKDPRITKIGHFIRRYSIDELPQLWDVLRGDMSLVGPRPQTRREVEAYPPDMHRRLLVRPGLTGLWQVSGRNDLAIDESIRLDLYYVDNWSITADLLIMLKTVRAVLASSGAY